MEIKRNSPPHQNNGLVWGQAKIQDHPLPWHALPLERVLVRLRTDPHGLSEEEAKARQLAWGRNALPKVKKTTALKMFLRQFGSPLVYILLIAAALSAAIKEYPDMIVILVVVGVNSSIGFYQEYRASRIFERLKSLVKVEALVIRGGKLKSLNSEELVPGDVIMLKGGSKVPADARLLSLSNLETSEALLTGESKPVKKNLLEIPAKSLVGDRSNMVFMGTVVEHGEGQAIVVTTGGRTEIGQISALTQSTDDEQTPLQVRITRLGTFLTEIFVLISGAIFLLGLLRGDAFVEIFTTTIAVAVAAIPEGLPAAISVILAVASQRIFKRQGLIMRLVAAETLGSTSVICTDKTGTLTYGQMQVEEILSDNKDEALLAMALANEAVIEEHDSKRVVKGETTDKAKLEAFLEAGGNLEETLKALPRIGILSFDEARKYIASFHLSRDKAGKDAKNLRIFLSGAPETVIEKCTVAPPEKGKLKTTYENLASRGFRIIGLAEKKLAYPKKPLHDSQDLINLVDELTFIGFAEIRDPIRDDVKQTILLTRKAGVKVLMMTGDHLLTAKAIGAELGFGTAAEAVVTGEELDQLSDQELAKKIGRLEILARVTPLHKMRIIKVWQKVGAVVAMTGDGVNDAPALKGADVGVALGTGTDVAKEASDLVLLNDSFSTITAAIAEGRTGFANIRKAVVVVMSNSFTEITLITGSLVFGTPFPITAVQILWVNIVEDSLPVLSLAFEPAEAGIMRQKPLSTREPILNQQTKAIIFAVGILMDILLFAIFFTLLKNSGWELVKIQSFIFMATAVPTLINIFAFKSLGEPIHKIKLTNNPFLLVSVTIGFVLMALAVYLPAFNHFLGTSPLPVWALLVILAFAFTKLILVEITKWWYNQNRKEIS